MNLSKGVTVKLFAGFIVTPELRMHLNESSAWKDAQLVHSDALMQTHHQGKDYIGLFLSDNQITLLSLKNIESKLRVSLEKYCPVYDLEKANIQIFPQSFIA
jgi:hypothetical protein